MPEWPTITIRFRDRLRAARHVLRGQPIVYGCRLYDQCGPTNMAPQDHVMLSHNVAIPSALNDGVDDDRR